MQLNRSDSDGAMPLYKRLPLQRRMLERRSLRLPSHPIKSMMPSHLPTNRQSIVEGQELRLPSGAAAKGNKSITTKSLNPNANKLQTPLDLELDLAAQQSRLKILQDEIDRLKAIKSKMEEAKTKGNKEIPDWLQEDEPFQELLSKVKQITEILIDCFSLQYCKDKLYLRINIIVKLNSAIVSVRKLWCNWQIPRRKAGRKDD